MIPGINTIANELAAVTLSATGTLWDTGSSGADAVLSGSRGGRRSFALPRLPLIVGDSNGT